MKTTKCNSAIIFAAFLSLLMIHNLPDASAQSDRQLHFLPIVPHGRTVNPAFAPSYSFYLGIPALSNINTGFENTINYEDIFQRKGDSLLIERDYLMANLKDESNINFNFQIEYLTFGFKAGKNYIHFRVAEKLQTEFMLRKDLVQFAMYGNGHESLLGKTVNLGGSSFDMMLYREYSLGYSRNVNEKLNVGANFKYLQGLANISTEKSDFELTTNPDDFSLAVRSDLLFNVSMPGINDEDIDLKFFLPGKANNGFAVDLGADYKINERFDAYASLLNLGSIKWTENLKNFETIDSQKIFVYEGFDISDYFSNGKLDNDRIENIFDSIADEMGIKETAKAYTSKLSPVLNVGGRFNLTKNNVFNVLLTNRFQNNDNWTTFSVAYTRSFTRDVNLMVSNTVFKDSFLNLGAGLAVNLGPLQLFAVSENILAPLYLTKTNIFNFRFGLILVFEPKGETVFPDSMPETETIK